MTEAEAIALGSKTKANLLALEATLTTDEQRAAAKALHRDLHRIARELRERWPDLFPEGDVDAFTIGGDKD